MTTSALLSDRLKAKFGSVGVVAEEDEKGTVGSVRITFGAHAIVPFDTLTELANHVNLETDDTHFEWISFSSFFESDASPSIPCVAASLKWRVIPAKEYLRRNRKGEGRGGGGLDESDDEEEADVEVSSPWERDLLKACGALNFKVSTEQMVCAFLMGRVTVEELEGMKARSKGGSIVSLVQGDVKGTLEVIVRHNVQVPFPPLSDHQRHCASATRSYRYL